MAEPTGITRAENVLSAASKAVQYARGVDIDGNSVRLPSAIAPLVTTGSASEQAAANATIVQTMLDAGVAMIGVPSGSYYLNNVNVSGPSVIVALSCYGAANASARCELKQPSGSTSRMFTVEDSGNLRLKGFALEGVSTGSHLVYAEDSATATRDDVHIDDCTIRNAGGDCVHIGLRRHSWKIRNSYIGDCVGYGVYSRGCEDAVMLQTQVSNAGKNLIWFDGYDGSDGGSAINVANLSLVQCDINTGATAWNGVTRSAGANIYIGPRTEDTRIVDCENFLAQGDGVYYASGILSRRMHSIIGGRFKAISSRTDDTYSCIYGASGGVSAIGVEFISYDAADTSIPKYLIEFAGQPGSANQSDLIGCIYRAAYTEGSDSYAGSYKTAVTDNFDRVRINSQGEQRGLSQKRITRADMADTTNYTESTYDLTGGGLVVGRRFDGRDMRGDGTNLPDVSWYRGAAGWMRVGEGQAVGVGKWSGIRLTSPNGTAYYLNADDSGILRIYNAIPGTDSDQNTTGTIVGTQS